MCIFLQRFDGCGDILDAAFLTIVFSKSNKNIPNV